MLNVRLTLTFLIFCFTSAARSEFTAQEIAQILQKANGELTQYGALDLNESTYLVRGDSILFNPQGRHYMFSYHKDRGTFLRIDRSEFHGHNFGRKLFLHKGEVYAIGGYGFWQTHGKLIHFSNNTHEWEYVMVKGPTPTGLPAISFVKGDSLYILYTIEKHPEINVDSIANTAYIINLNTFESTQFLITEKRRLDFYRPAWNDQNTHLCFFGYNGGVMHVVDKNQMRLYISSTTPNLFKGFPQEKQSALDSNFVIFENNNIRVFPKGFDPVTFKSEEFLALYFTSVNILDLLVPIKSSKPWFRDMLLWIMVFIVILVFALIWVFSRSSRWVSEFQKYRWNGVYRSLKHEPYYADIRTMSSGNYSQQDIDVALRIAHFSPQIKRLKRSVYIEELNRMQPGFIEKVARANIFSKPKYKLNK